MGLEYIYFNLLSVILWTWRDFLYKNINQWENLFFSKKHFVLLKALATCASKRHSNFSFSVKLKFLMPFSFANMIHKSYSKDCAFQLL